MTRVQLIYALGVLAAALAGFFCPWWYLGFLPIAAGLVWAAYDLVEVSDVADAPPAPRR